MKIRIKENASKLYWGHINARGSCYCPTNEERYFGEKLESINGKTVDVETQYLFSDQYNIGPVSPDDKNGLRIMAEYVDEVIDDIRDNVGQCPYCGHNTIGKTEGFCDKCTDDSYLSAEDVVKGFTRIRPIGAKRESNELIPLTDDEKAKLLPIYVKRQTTGKNSRNAITLREKRKRLKDDCRKQVRLARMERDGMLWLMAKNINLDNCIFYNHTETFTFGWRKKLSSDVEQTLRTITVGFPFKLSFKD